MEYHSQFEHSMLEQVPSPEKHEQRNDTFGLIIPESAKAEAVAILKRNKIKFEVKEHRQEIVLDTTTGTSVPAESLISLPREQSPEKKMEEADLQAIQRLLDEHGILVRNARA